MKMGRKMIALSKIVGSEDSLLLSSGICCTSSVKRIGSVGQHAKLSREYNFDNFELPAITEKFRFLYK